ncbi:MAG: hypothetical protein IJ770_04140 [Alphaproteobacteria bacterium]|nr:hypothetical protein [Alphaproteobacteria bacterium]
MEITISDVRRAISYGHDCGIEEMSDEELLACDFMKDFNFGNIRVANIAMDLQRMYNIFLPVEFFQDMKDNTVRSFIEAANKYLTD